MRQLELSLIDNHKWIFKEELKKRLKQYFGQKNVDYTMDQISTKQTIYEDYTNKIIGNLKNHILINKKSSNST